jgi:hypothetical protein
MNASPFLLRFQVGPLCKVHVFRFKGSDKTLQMAKLRSFQRLKVTACSDKVSGCFRGFSQSSQVHTSCNRYNLDCVNKTET